MSVRWLARSFMLFALSLAVWACADAGLTVTDGDNGTSTETDYDFTEIPDGDTPPDGDPEASLPDGDIPIDGDPDVLPDGDLDDVEPDLDPEVDVEGPAEHDTDLDAEPAPETDGDAFVDYEPDFEAGGLYVGTENPYSLALMDTAIYDVAKDTQGAPVAMKIFTPAEEGEYAVIVYQHGFLMANHYYTTLLNHIASHGFIVVAPQMYTAGPIPIGQPTAYEEAALALSLYEWLPDHLNGYARVTARMDRLGLSGHSRGGKVIWIVLSEHPELADAVAGVDPVDGQGGPLGGEERIIDGAFDLDFPSLILGTGLGPLAASIFSPACAPEGDNHEQFYAASPSPAFHVIAPEYGHNDMLEDAPIGCTVECTSCLAGPSRAPMRTLTAGLLVAFFRATLQGDVQAFDYLTDTQSAPISVTVETK